MRRLSLVTVMSLFIVGLFAAVAYAAVITCTGGERCRGTDEADTIIGSDGPERIFAQEGNDFVKPSNGRERDFGAGGDDDMYGGRGKDRMFGGLGNDYLVAGDGEDQLNGGDGNDVLVTGPNDKVKDEITCGPGVDVTYLKAGDNDSGANDCEESINFRSFEEIAAAHPDIVGEAGDPSDPAPESGDPDDIN